MIDSTDTSVTPQAPPDTVLLHPRALEPVNLALAVVLSFFGAIVGIQMLVNLGITPSTSLIGALVAMTLSRLPVQLFRRFRSIHIQNLAQTSISSATFGAANCLFLPIGIPWLFGLPEMVMPMLAGVSAAMLLDGWLLYRMYDTPAFPASNPWPPGVAAAEAIHAGDKGGKQAWTLIAGLFVGAAGALAHLPASAFGVALIGGFGAMLAFALGLLIRGYSLGVLGTDIAALYLPHGMMIGAGLVALVQVAKVVFRQGTRGQTSCADRSSGGRRLGQALRVGSVGYLIIMLCLTLATGLYQHMSLTMLLFFMLYGAFAAFVHELIVGIAAMHSGWFPAFAVALITLLIGMLLGFPPQALIVLVGFSTATGPAFADMGFDLKAGSLLRASEQNPQFELAGRRQQLIAGMIGFVVAIIVVALSYHFYFTRQLFAPINSAFVATIKAGVSAEVAHNLMIWAIPGALLQLLGGSRRQLGVLFATGLLISSPAAGWMVAAGVLSRLLISRLFPEQRKKMEVFAGGVIAGDALLSFFTSAIGVLRK